MNAYQPNPVDTSSVTLSPEILELTERLAENAHDHWARQRIADGWSLGATRDDKNKRHPCLISYKDLPEEEKVYDRQTATETLKAIMVFGYNIKKHESN